MKLNKKDIIIGLAGGIVTIGIGFNALYYACASITTPTTQIEIFNEVDFNSMSTKELSKKFSKSMAHMISSKDYQTSVTVEYIVDGEYWIDFDIHTNCRTNEYTKGYKVLDPHIGCIYGDAITLERAEEICRRLESKGFASSNIVFGIGSYTYNMNTRDTFGFALKTTYGKVDGKELLLYKDPITDDGTKKSQKGMVRVYQKDGVLLYDDELDYNQKYNDIHEQDLLIPVFKDGKLLVDYSLQEVRERLRGQYVKV